jgi:hypothetical protein
MYIFKLSCADHLMQGDEKAVYAHKSYDSRARRSARLDAGIADGIVHRARGAARSDRGNGR